jgi:GNAT superfamily N-acetyltransferase
MECIECGMLYVAENKQERRRHQAHHDKIVNGHKYRKYESERRIVDDEQCVITVVGTHSNYFEMARAVDVGILGHVESRFDSRPFDQSELSNPESKVTVFLVHTQDRTVGILVTDKARPMWKMKWREFEVNGDPAKLSHQDPIWCGRFIWVHKKYRQQGLAKRLINAALLHFDAAIEDFGYSSQFSDLGKTLAKSISPIFIRAT